MAINPVGTVGFGAQPVQEKKKASPVLPAAAGAVAGGALGYFKLGKSPEFDSVDTFIKSDLSKALGEIKDDSKAADKTKLTDAKTAYDTDGKAAETSLGKLFPKDDAEATVTDVLKEVKDAPKLADIQATIAAKDDDITKSETELASIKEAADGLEKGKDKVITVGDSAIQVKKDDKDAITFIRGKEEGEPKAFKAGAEAPVDFAAHQKAIADKRTNFTKHKDLADALGITDKTTADAKIKKPAAESALKATISTEAKTAFDNIKDLLPTKISGLKVAGIAAAGAAIAGIAAMVIGGGSDKNK